MVARSRTANDGNAGRQTTETRHASRRFNSQRCGHMSHKHRQRKLHEPVQPWGPRRENASQRWNECTRNHELDARSVKQVRDSKACERAVFWALDIAPVGEHHPSTRLRHPNHFSCNYRRLALVSRLNEQHRCNRHIERRVRKVDSSCIPTLDVRGWKSSPCRGGALRQQLDAAEARESECVQIRERFAMAAANVQHGPIAPGADPSQTLDECKVHRQLLLQDPGIGQYVVSIFPFSLVVRSVLRPNPGHVGHASTLCRPALVSASNPLDSNNLSHPAEGT
jgi:hypothetical protein